MLQIGICQWTCKYICFIVKVKKEKIEGMLRSLNKEEKRGNVKVKVISWLVY